MFVGRSPPRDQYEYGRGHNFESQMSYGPCFPFYCTCTPLVRRQMFPHGGSSFDRRDRMDFPYPTFEEMARH
jgi:hypothetical protein